MTTKVTKIMIANLILLAVFIAAFSYTALAQGWFTSSEYREGYNKGVDAATTDLKYCDQRNVRECDPADDRCVGYNEGYMSVYDKQYNATKCFQHGLADGKAAAKTDAKDSRCLHGSDYCKGYQIGITGITPTPPPTDITKDPEFQKGLDEGYSQGKADAAAGLPDEVKYCHSNSPYCQGYTPAFHAGYKGQPKPTGPSPAPTAH